MINLCKIVAIFDELKLESVEDALVQRGVAGFTLHSVRGRGRYFDSFNEKHLIKHIQIEIYAPEEHVASICNVIMQTAQSNADSEGLVTVLPVKELYWIHSKSAAVAEDFHLKKL